MRTLGLIVYYLCSLTLTESFLHRQIYCPRRSASDVRLKLSCPRCHVLVHVDAVVYAGNTAWKTIDLLLETTDCYWKRHCYIHFPTDSLVMCQTSMPWLCPGFGSKNQEYIQIRRAKCVKQSVISDLSTPILATRLGRSVDGENIATKKKGTGGRKKKNAQKKTKKQKKGKTKTKRKCIVSETREDNCSSEGQLTSTVGIIRSHESFPNYYHSSYICPSSKLKLRSKQSLSYAIDVHMMGICEFDSLKIESGSWSEENFTSIQEQNQFGEYIYEFRTNASHDLTLTFTVDSTTRGCGGFVINYQGFNVPSCETAPDKCEINKLLKDAKVKLIFGEKKIKYKKTCCKDEQWDCELGDGFFFSCAKD